MLLLHFDDVDDDVIFKNKALLFCVVLAKNLLQPTFTKQKIYSSFTI